MYIGRYSSWMWILTFFTYCSYHMSRKPISVVKNVLDQNCSEVTPPPGTDTNNSHWCEWAPFGEFRSTVGYILLSGSNSGMLPHFFFTLAV